LIITIYIFNKFKNLSPGELTDLRKLIVSNDSLAFTSTKIYNLQNFLFYDSFFVQEKIQKYLKSNIGF
jgi:dsRNA-specific ribonuclease